jgi:dolichyl-phosphate-mannose-protein mannosyltransferase
MRKSRSPAPPSQAVSQSSKKASKSYASEGATDNDIFLLPMSDYQIMGVMTLLAAAVRLFRIYQPSSVVFDEVQYAATPSLLPSDI